MQIRSKQLLLIAAAVCLTVALYLAPKKNILSSDVHAAVSDEASVQPVHADSARFYESIAVKNNDEKSWLNAAYRYFDAWKMSEDSVDQQVLMQKAIGSYEKVLSINPENLDAKTDLGICYAEGTNQPMRGIMMLREVVEKNPQHENAQFNLGILSMKSGQYQKAAERFAKVLSINPQNEGAKKLKQQAEEILSENKVQ